MPAVPAARLAAAVWTGGFAGAIARVALSRAWPAGPGHWPWATLLANLAGAALLAHLVARTPASATLASYRHPLLGVGFCGALSTFSTLQLELLEMLDRGRLAAAAGYAGVSVLLGLAVVVAATRLARARSSAAA